MLSSKCPGQDTRYWSPEDIREEECPHCGGTMEFWKTDVKLRCQHCGNKVTNPNFDLGCAQWCSFAEYCLGDVAKGYRQPETVKDLLMDEAYHLIEKEQISELQDLMETAEETATKEKEEVLPVLAGVFLKYLEIHCGKKKMQSVINKLEGSAKLPSRSIQEINSVLAELNRNSAPSTSAQSYPAQLAGKILQHL